MMLTGSDAAADRRAFETSCSGVFAIGDVRSGSVKRVAAAVGEGAQVVATLHAFLAAAGLSPAALSRGVALMCRPKSSGRSRASDFPGAMIGRTCENEVAMFARLVARKTGLVQGLAVGESSKSPSAGWIIGTLLSKLVAPCPPRLAT
jgi:hypothetical protein